MKIYYDDKVVISIAHIQVQSDCTKHVELGKSLMKEKIETEQISTSFVATKLLEKESQQS